MQTHYMGFLRATSSRLHFNISADSSSVHFLIAHFPSSNFATRGDALLALNDLYSSGAEHERSSWDPNAYYHAAMAAQSELSDDILERMEIHMGGQLMTSDIYVNTRATDDFQAAMATVLEDKDMYTLAKKLYPLILSTESSIPQGAFRDKHGELIPLDELGLPFSSFIDALPHAADAIRMRGIPGERLAADVIEVKHALLTRQNAVVRQICSERIETDPHVAFFYYALVLAASSSGGDPSTKRMPTAERLKLAKRGLLCEGASNYIRLGLHKVASECGYKLGIDRLKTASGPPMGLVKATNDAHEDSDEDEELSPRRTMKYYTEAVVYLTSALHDARSYTKGAPLDYRLHKNVLLMETILDIVLEGKTTQDLESLLSQQEIVDELYTTLYTEIPKTHSRLIVNSILPNWESAQQEWDALLRKFDRRAPVGAPEHTHNHPHDVEGELQGELEPELDFGGLDIGGRPPTYVSRLDIPALVHPTGALVPALNTDKTREEENLRQAYAGLAAWMEGAPNLGISGDISGNSLGIPGISRFNMDFEPLLEFLQPHLPPFAFHILLNLASSLSSTISTLIYALTHPSDPDSVDVLKSLVPTLLSFLALYFTIMSVVRTIRSVVYLVFFMVKWVAILSALALGVSYVMGGGNAADGPGDLTARLHEFEAAYKEHAQPPKEGKTGSRSMWDRFDARDREAKDGGKLWWQKDKDTTPPTSDSPIEYVYKQVVEYKWVWDALMDTQEDVGSERTKRAKTEKTKPRVNAKSKAEQRVR
ncbi:hypothetical protein FRC11_011533 [Ceratobasidium sp. 423]|nr:hypothetical protein FRC11_011533 [Ceratobasidium sp. 423]